jgi:hypothetical protein
MLAAIKQHAVVKKGGIIEIFVPDFDEDSEIEVEGELTLHVAERDDTAICFPILQLVNVFYARWKTLSKGKILWKYRLERKIEQSFVTFSLRCSTF